MSDKGDHPPSINRRLVLQNDVFNVYLDEVSEGGKVVVKDFLVLSQKNRREEDLVAGVAALPIYEGKIGLLKIFRHPVMECVWEAPRGFIDKDELSVDAATRELEEETGLAADAKNMVALGAIMPEAGVFSTRIELFAAMECKKIRDFKSAELGHKELKFFEISEIEDMITRSEIQDPCTLVSFFKYKSIRDSCSSR